ncbi:MAG: hypothetical protein NVS9B4_05370 [Candidatus Acidiferrum sp.]
MLQEHEWEWHLERQAGDAENEGVKELGKARSCVRENTASSPGGRANDKPEARLMLGGF